ncbi:hypothetical protein ACQPYK_13360 [Streptosporangium sp. CA-135522]|uniref:hypothetical protein n=1 Tax=Streptosporangium sp. CA-135522 TaxID=3240072 RepID=UPI003D8E5A77
MPLKIIDWPTMRDVPAMLTSALACFGGLYWSAPHPADPRQEPQEPITGPADRW